MGIQSGSPHASAHSDDRYSREATFAIRFSFFAKANDARVRC